MKKIFQGISKGFQGLRLISRDHRHLVVGPIFILILFFSVLPHAPLASLSETGETGRIVAEKEEYIPLNQAAGMVVLPGGSAQRKEDGTWELMGGSAVVYGREWVTIVFRDSFVRGYDGAFYVVAAGDRLTIAALTSPALFIQGTDHMLIPAETQWRTEGSLEFKEWESWLGEREVQLLPSEFLQEYAGRVHSLKERFSNSEESADGEGANILELIRDVVTDRAGWLMASIHPHLRDRAWVVGTPEDAGRYDVPLRLLMFPSSDVLSRKIDTFTVERWMRELRQFLDTERDPGPFFNTLISHIAGLVDFADSHRYPERSKQYREVLRSLTESHGYLLTRSMRVNLEELQNREVFSIAVSPEEEPAESPPEEAKESSQPFDAAAVEALVYEAMRDAGVLFTVQTQITPLSAQRAKVDGVVFGESIFSFAFDLATGEVNQIVRDDESLPYAVPLRELAEWVILDSQGEGT